MHRYLVIILLIGAILMTGDTGRALNFPILEGIQTFAAYFGHSYES